MSNSRPWSIPRMATHAEIRAASERDFADRRPVVEGGCFFSHVGGIDELEKAYVVQRREGDPRFHPPSPEM